MARRDNDDSPSEFPGLTMRDVEEARRYAEAWPMVQESCVTCGAPLASFRRRPDLPRHPGISPPVCVTCGGTIRRWDDVGVGT